MFLTLFLSPDFNNKLQAIGFELSDEGSSTFTFDQEQGSKASANVSSQRHASNAGKKPSSIYRLVSKKCPEEQKPVVLKSSSSLKKVKFEEHNTSTESEDSSVHAPPQYTTDTDHTDDTEDDYDRHTEESQSESQESFDDTYDSSSESSIPESYKSPSKRHDHLSPAEDNFVPRNRSPDEDDISMSAFVPDSVRRQSIHQSHEIDSSEESSYTGTGASTDEQTRKKLRMDDTDSEEDGDTAEMDDLLDEAMDDLDDVDMVKDPVPLPVSRISQITEGQLEDN